MDKRKANQRNIHQPATKPRILKGDARKLEKLEPKSIDLVVTSPPYWRGRDYEHPKQIGHESSPDKYIEALTNTLESWRHLLRPHSSVFVNIADTFNRGFLVGIPAKFEIAVRNNGWRVANHIIWAKDYGMPEANSNRLARRHESIFHLTLSRNYFFDLYALEQHLGRFSNPGNVWRFHHERSKSDHLAPFPSDLARYVIILACPERVCCKCSKPYSRILTPTAELDVTRLQARRALEIYKGSSLTEEHLAAIRAVGISDAGKGSRVQNGAGKNTARVQELAQEAKDVLGGYFREFTFARKRQKGWRRCGCRAQSGPGTVLDPFLGSGTTLRVAKELGFNCVGVDLNSPTHKI